MTTTTIATITETVEDVRPSTAAARHIANIISPPPAPRHATDIRLTHAGEVIISFRAGEVYVGNIATGGRKIKRFFHSEGDGEEFQNRGLGYKTARQAADALAEEIGWAK